MFKLESYRISTLEGKVIFFEGQLDPLYNSNMSLKEQVVALSKLVARSCGIRQ